MQHRHNKIRNLFNLYNYVHGVNKWHKNNLVIVFFIRCQIKKKVYLNYFSILDHIYGLELRGERCDASRRHNNHQTVGRVPRKLKTSDCYLYTIGLLVQHKNVREKMQTLWRGYETVSVWLNMLEFLISDLLTWLDTTSR